MTETQPAVEPLGARIRRIRSSRGLSQDRLAIEADFDQSGLSKVERGKTTISKSSLSRIADALGITTEELTRGTDYHERAP